MVKKKAAVMVKEKPTYVLFCKVDTPIETDHGAEYVKAGERIRTNDAELVMNLTGSTPGFGCINPPKFSLVENADPTAPVKVTILG